MSARSFKIDRTKQYSNVAVFSSPEFLRITLHSTDVVVFDRQRNVVVLNSGGWRTPTTKTAINNALRQLESLVGQEFPTVSQKNFKWFLEYFDKNGFRQVEFQDGIELAVYPLMQALS